MEWHGNFACFLQLRQPSFLKARSQTFLFQFSRLWVKSLVVMVLWATLSSLLLILQWCLIPTGTLWPFSWPFSLLLHGKALPEYNLWAIRNGKACSSERKTTPSVQGWLVTCLSVGGPWVYKMAWLITIKTSLNFHGHTFMAWVDKRLRYPAL